MTSIHWSTDAELMLLALPPSVAERIFEAVEEVAAGERAAVLGLAGESVIHLAVPGFRVVIELTPTLLIVHRIVARGA